MPRPCLGSCCCCDVVCQEAGALRRLLIQAIVLLVLTVGALPWAGTAAQSPRTVAVHIFWSEGCPHCARALGFLGRLAQEEPRVELHSYEIEGNPGNLDLFIRANRLFDIAGPAVPLIIIGDEARIGFLSDATTGREIAGRVQHCLRSGCSDGKMRFLLDGARVAPGAMPAPAEPSSLLPETIEFPFVGSLSTAALSLPLLTVAFALVDGFNPCAMWVLVFLIGLLLGVEDRLRMWLLGLVFLAASGAVYFALMTAWLNVLLVIDTRLWIRVAVGILALGAAAYYVRDYIRPPRYRTDAPGNDVAARSVQLHYRTIGPVRPRDQAPPPIPHLSGEVEHLGAGARLFDPSIPNHGQRPAGRLKLAE